MTQCARLGVEIRVHAESGYSPPTLETCSDSGLHQSDVLPLRSFAFTLTVNVPLSGNVRETESVSPLATKPVHAGPVESLQLKPNATESPSGSVAVALKVTGTPTTPELGPEMTGTVGALSVRLQEEPIRIAAPIAAAANVNAVLPILVSVQLMPCSMGRE